MYYGNPGIKWSVQLPDTGTGFQSQLASGNAVQVSPDNLLVYTTLDDGRLEILVASNGKRRWGNTPTPVDASAGWTVKSQSGVYFGNSATLGLFAVYAIIDVAPAGTGLDDRSRVVAVSHPQNNLLWVSDSVPGQIQGTPIVTRDGKYIFFTHNENVSSDAPFGSFSMVHAEDNGKLLFTEVAGSSSDDPVPTRVETLLQPYGPLGVAHSPTEGRYLAGFTNSNDVFIWSTSTSEGKDPNGYTRAFQIPPFFSPPFARKYAVRRENKHLTRRDSNCLFPFFYSVPQPVSKQASCEKCVGILLLRQIFLVTARTSFLEFDLMVSVGGLVRLTLIRVETWFRPWPQIRLKLEFVSGLLYLVTFLLLILPYLL
jgi:hypothetical protein